MAYAATRLAEELARSGHDVHLHVLEPRPEKLPDVPTTFYPPRSVLRSLGASEQMSRSLDSVSAEADIMHVHGLWRMPVSYAGSAMSRSRGKLVVSPSGMMQPWARSWRPRRKKVFERVIQDRALRIIDCFHATSSIEAEAVQSAGFDKPIGVIPVGIDMPAKSSHPPEEVRQVTYLGRLHPIKNLEALIEAWTQIENRHRDWRLVIAGSGEPEYVRSLEVRAAATERVVFVGPVYGAEKDALLRRSSLLVLPSHSENFGIVIAEALGYGIPVVATTGSPWAALESRRCGWWVRPDAIGLRNGLQEALSTSVEQRRAMGAAGRRWMEDQFSWGSVSAQMECLYRWLRVGGQTPPFVQRDHEAV